MNHLAHFLLAPADDDARKGTLLGDFVRGNHLAHWPAGVERAIRLHRRIDAFTDTHAILADARTLVSTPLRRYAGILLDVYFDHLLIGQWDQWHAAPLAHFADEVHDTLARIAPALPESAARLATGMAMHRGLLACASSAGMQRVLTRIGSRLSRPVNLAEGVPALHAARAPLEMAFRRFFPLLQGEASAYLAAPSRNTRPSELSVNR